MRDFAGDFFAAFFTAFFAGAFFTAALFTPRKIARLFAGAFFTAFFAVFFVAKVLPLIDDLGSLCHHCARWNELKRIMFGSSVPDLADLTVYGYKSPFGGYEKSANNHLQDSGNPLRDLCFLSRKSVRL